MKHHSCALKKTHDPLPAGDNAPDSATAEALAAVVGGVVVWDFPRAQLAMLYLVTIVLMLSVAH
jgi:hypothetical protein